MIKFSTSLITGKCSYCLVFTTSQASPGTSKYSLVVRNIYGNLLIVSLLVASTVKRP